MRDIALRRSYEVKLLAYGQLAGKYASDVLLAKQDARFIAAR